MCNHFHFAYCVNHTRLALANRCLQNSLWDRKPSPHNPKKRKPSPSPHHKNSHLAHHPPPVPIHTCTSSSASMHVTAYRGGKHLARRLPPLPGCRQTPPHFATSACCRLSPSTSSTLLAVDPAPLGWGICHTEGFFLMDDNVTNLMRYYLISHPSSSASFNHASEITVNSFLFELI